MRKFISIILYMFSSFLLAQNNNNLWTLEECIRYANENNIDIKQKIIIKENLEIDLNNAQMSRLPDFNTELVQEWDFGRSNNNSSGVYEIQTISTAGLSVYSNITLFSGFKINNEIEKQKLDLKASIKNLEKAKENLALNITSLFLKILYNQEILKVNIEQLSLSHFQVELTEQLVKAGKGSITQLCEIKAQEAKDEVNVIQAKKNLRLSKFDLAQNLGIKQDFSFNIVTPELDDILKDDVQNSLLPEDIYDNAVKFKSQIREFILKKESAEKSLKIAQAGYVPILSIELGYESAYYNDYSSSLESFPNQFLNNSGQYFALTLEIPLFNRFETRNQIRTAKLNIENQYLLLEKEKNILYKEILIAYENAMAAQETYYSLQKSVTASKESYKYTEERYKMGKASVFEFIEAKNRLGQNLSEQIQSKYEFIFRSKILDFYNGLPIKL